MKNHLTFRLLGALCLVSLLFITFPAHVLGQTIKVVDPEIFNKMALKAWESIGSRPFKGDFSDIDGFLRDFPSARISPDVFSIRYSLVQASGDIKIYNEFIAKYPGRLSTSMAIEEVYSLYERINTMGGYIDFVSRYPSTAQAVLALQKINQIAFELAVKRDKLEDYESFVCLFPEAPQSAKVRDLALEKRLEDEEAFLSKPENQSTEERERRANNLAVQMGEAITKADKAVSSGPKALYYSKANILMNVLNKKYADFPAALQVREEARHQQLNAKLNQLDATLKKNHDDLVEQLQKEFAETRKSIADGINALKLDNDETRKLLAAGFKELEEKSEQLHQDLLGLHDQLATLNTQIADVRQGIRETNQELAGIREDLHRQYSEYRILATAIGKGFEANSEILSEVSRGMNAQNGLLGQIADGKESQISNVNMLIAQKTGAIKEQYSVNKGSYTPVKSLHSTAHRTFDTWTKKGTKAAINEALDAAPGLLAEAVGYAVDRIPLGGEFLAAPAAEIVHQLGAQGIKSVHSLSLQEIEAYSRNAGQVFPGCENFVRETLLTCRQETLDRETEIDTKMGNFFPGEITQFIAANF